MTRSPIELPWQEIRHVLLDMDGTLLDLHFDNHFWLEYVPRRFAEANDLSYEESHARLMRRYTDIQGTLNWYCVDHWSRELGLDIALLKQEVDHLIQVHPHVLDFLDWLHRGPQRVWLVTNAHQKALSLKMERTRLAGYFDRIVCAHDLGLPKEDRAFWPRLQTIESFDPARTLFVDDSVSVLASARDYGIRWLLQILAPDSKGEVRGVGEYPAVRDFSELIRGEP